VFGGLSGPPTAPGAGSGNAPRQRPLRDGAAFDPRTRTWRRIARAPIGLEPLSPTTVDGDSVYVAVPRNPGARDTRMDLLAYRLRADRWDRLPSAPRRNYAIGVAGGRLLAAGPLRGPAPFSLFELGPGERRWRDLPPPPFRGALVWDGKRVIVIGYDPAANRGKPAWARAATLELGDSAWRRLPDSDSVLWGHGFWVPVGDRLVSPELGMGDPGYHPAGRPYGGILDPERGIWSELPNTGGLGGEFGTGVLTRRWLVGGSPDTLVLDMTREEWVRVPPLWGDRNSRSGWSTFNTRRGLVLLGGARFDRRHPAGQLLRDAWLWTPPR
jgi:hypothetical protein